MTQKVKRLSCGQKRKAKGLNWFCISDGKLGLLQPSAWRHSKVRNKHLFHAPSLKPFKTSTKLGRCLITFFLCVSNFLPFHFQSTITLRCDFIMYDVQSCVGWEGGNMGAWKEEKKANKNLFHRFTSTRRCTFVQTKIPIGVRLYH